VGSTYTETRRAFSLGIDSEHESISLITGTYATTGFSIANTSCAEADLW
jgi:hypothetical protein